MLMLNLLPEVPYYMVYQRVRIPARDARRIEAPCCSANPPPIPSTNVSMIAIVVQAAPCPEPNVYVYSYI